MEIRSAYHHRYRLLDDEILPGYFVVEDILAHKELLGKLVPLTPSNHQVLRFWTGVRHPSFLKVYRFLRKNDEILVLLEHPGEHQVALDVNPRTLSANQVVGLFSRMLAACLYLRDHQMTFPLFNLEHLLITSSGELKILGHETASVVAPQWSQEQEPSIDLRYMPPDWNQHDRSTPFMVHYLGALFYHFITGRLPQQGEIRITDRFRRLKRGWDPLLSDMLCTDHGERPSWEHVVDRFLRVLNPEQRRRVLAEQWAVKPIEREPFSRELLPLLDRAIDKPQAFAFECHPGPELIRRIAPLVEQAEARSYITLHCWGPHKSGDPYAIVNQLVHLIKKQLALHPSASALAQELVPLTQWREGLELISKWKPTLERLVDSLFPHAYKGALIIAEDVHHMDRQTLDAFVSMGHLLKRAPVVFVFTAQDRLCGAMRELIDAWPFEVGCGLPSRLNRTQFDDLIDVPAEFSSVVERLECAFQLSDRREVPFFQMLKQLRRGQAPSIDVLDRHWAYLLPKEQLILKALSCSQRSLGEVDFQSAMSLSGTIECVQPLIRQGIIQLRGQDLPSFYIASEIHRNYCRSNLGSDEVRYICQQLLDHEDRLVAPDPLQRLALLLQLGQFDEAERLARSIEDHFMKSWDLSLWKRLGPLLEMAGMGPLNRLVAVRDLVAGRSVKADSPLHKAWALARRYAAGDRERDSARQWFKLSARRGLTQATRGYFTVEGALASARCQDRLGVGKANRLFQAIDLGEVFESSANIWRTKMATALLSVGRKADAEAICVALSEPMRSWLEAVDAWHDNDFDRCADCVKRAIPFAEMPVDLIFKGDIFKLFGNSQYRINRADRAIEYYAIAAERYQEADHHAGVDRLAFNRATSEKLAGRFHLATARFEGVLAKAKEKDDLLTQCQSLYNLAVVATLQERSDAESLCRQHLALARRLRDRAESVRGLVLLLHRSFALTHSEIEQISTRLSALLEKGGYFELLVEEAQFAIRLGRFVRGLDSPVSPSEKGIYTEWRHNLLNWIEGEDRSFEELIATIGAQLFGAYHFYLLRAVIVKGMVGPRLLSQDIADRIQQHGRDIGWDPGRFFATHFSHLRKYSEMPRPRWEQILRVYEEMPDEGEPMWTYLLEHLAVVFPYTSFGVLTKEKGEWHHHAQFVRSEWVEQTVASVSMRLGRDPLMTRVPMGQDGYGHLLLMPVRPDQTLLWFLDAQGQFMAYGQPLEPLFRFFTRSFRGVHLGVSEVEPAQEVERKEELMGLIGGSANMRELRSRIRLLGPTDLHIHICGESGTGKELVALALHHQSVRRQQVFRAINCSQLPENLAESELFGHARGAFTGAVSQRRGLLELTDGGTLFIDEIGDLSPRLQVLLLRVIQEGEFCRVGDQQIRKVDLRIVTATHKDLRFLIDHGQFRKDLFFRIAEDQIDVPPLRARLEDLSALASHFAHKHFESRSVLFTKDLLSHLATYSWPGNVREYESYIRRLMFLHPETSHFSAKQAEKFMMEDSRAAPTYGTLAEMEADHRAVAVGKRLKEFGGNRTRTAESLDISRQSLLKYIREFNLDEQDSL